MNEINLIENELAVDILSFPSISGALMTIVNGLKQHIEYTREESFKNFNRNLFSDFKVESQEEREKLINLIYITMKEYKLFLSAAMEEEDKKKEYLYVNIYKYILKNRESLSEKDMLKYLRISKQLPYSAIDILPQIYIYKNNHTKNKSFKSYMNEIMIEHTYEVNILEHNAIISLGMGASFGGPNPSIHKINFNELINVFFTKDDLNPTKYNIEIWKNKKALIVTDDAFGEGYDVDKIKPILNELSIPSEAHKFTTELKETFSHFIFNMDNNRNQGINDIEKMNKNNKIIKISFKIQSGKTDVLNLNDENDIQKFKEQFSD